MHSGTAVLLGRRRDERTVAHCLMTVSSQGWSLGMVKERRPSLCRAAGRFPYSCDRQRMLADAAASQAIACLLRADEIGLDGSDGVKRRAGEGDIPGRILAGAVQSCLYGILASAILAMAAVGATPDGPETLLRAVPSPRNRHNRVHSKSLNGTGAFAPRLVRHGEQEARPTLGIQQVQLTILACR